MTRTLHAPEAAHAFARPFHDARPRIGLFQRWLAGFIAARERKAARMVLARLEDHMARAGEADRADLQAIADRLRRSLR
jgi:hypothetical protein